MKRRESESLKDLEALLLDVMMGRQETSDEFYRAMLIQLRQTKDLAHKAYAKSTKARSYPGPSHADEVRPPAKELAQVNQLYWEMFDRVPASVFEQAEQPSGDRPSVDEPSKAGEEEATEEAESHLTSEEEADDSDGCSKGSTEAAEKVNAINPSLLTGREKADYFRKELAKRRTEISGADDETSSS